MAGQIAGSPAVETDEVPTAGLLMASQVSAA